MGTRRSHTARTAHTARAAHTALRALPMREVLALSLPAMAQGLLVTVVFLTDRALLGRYSGEGLGVMQVCGPSVWTLFALLSALEVGLMAVVGRRVGAGDAAGAAEAARGVMVASLCIGAALAALASPLSSLVVWVGGRAAPELAALSVSYALPLFVSAPLKMLGGAACAAMQAGGDTRTPMWISLACGLLNLVASWGLIYGVGPLPALGVPGAAWGSAASFALQGLLATLCLARAHSAPRVSIPDLTGALLALARPKGVRALLTALAPAARVTRGALGERAGYHVIYLLYAEIISTLGVLAMSAHQVALAVESIGFICADAFGVAASALVAQRVGARDLNAAAAAAWGATLLASGSMLAVSALYWTTPERLVALVTHDPEVAAAAVPCLLAAAVAQPLMAGSCALSGALRGAGDTLSPMVIMIAGPLVFRLGACWLFGHALGWGVFGVWVGTTIDWGVRFALLAWAMSRGRWRRCEV